MAATLASLIDCADPTSGDLIAELADIRDNHPKVAALPLAEIVDAIEHPIIHTVEIKAKEIVHDAESIASKVWHWGGEEIAKLEDALKGHPNRLPGPSADPTQPGDPAQSPGTLLGTAASLTSLATGDATDRTQSEPDQSAQGDTTSGHSGDAEPGEHADGA